MIFSSKLPNSAHTHDVSLTYGLEYVRIGEKIEAPTTPNIKVPSILPKPWVINQSISIESFNLHFTVGLRAQKLAYALTYSCSMCDSV